MNRTTTLFRLFKPFLIWPIVSYYRIIHPTLLENALAVFVFHDISDEPSEFSLKYDLNVPPSLFECQIRFIKKQFNLISPDDLLESKIAPKAALITFDDGFRSFFKNAIPILEKHQVPCLMFMNMAPINGEIFWAGLITYLCEKRPDFVQYLKFQTTPKNRRSNLFLSCSTKIVNSYLEKIGDDLGNKISRYVGEFAEKEDLEWATKKDFVFYGNHLYNHYVPLLMSDEELLESFNKNSDELNKYPNYRNIFSFPFGQPESCFSQKHVELLIANGAMKVFRSTGTINYDMSASYLDRIALTSNHNSSAKIWFKIFQHRMNCSAASRGVSIDWLFPI